MQIYEYKNLESLLSIFLMFFLRNNNDLLSKNQSSQWSMKDQLRTQIRLLVNLLCLFQGSLGGHHNPSAHPALTSHQFMNSPREHLEEKKPVPGNSPSKSHFF